MSLKLFGKNTVVYATGNIGARAGSFLLIPLYTHFLSLGDYGLLATLLISIQIMLTLMSMGMRTTLLRFTKEYQVNNRIDDLLGTSSLINLLGSLIATGASFAFFIPFFRCVLHSDDVYLYVGLACCAASLQSLNMHVISYYRARQEAVKYMIAGVSAAALLFATSLVLVCVFKLSVTGALLAVIITHGTILLIVSMDVFSKAGFAISMSMMPQLLRFGCPLLFSNCGELVIGAAGIYFLSYFAGLDTVAIYSLGYKLTQLLGMTVVMPFSLAFQPYVFANLDTPGIKERISRLLTYLVLAVMSMSFLILLGSQILLPLIAPPEYSSAYLVILLLLPGVAFVGVYYFGETLLGAVKKTHIIGLAMAICAVLSIMLNYLLIPILDWYGAAISLNMSYILAGFTLLVIGMRRFSLAVEWKRIYILGALMLFLFFAFFTVRDINPILVSAGALIAALGGISVLLKAGFFHHDEIIAIKNLIPKPR